MKEEEFHLTFWEHVDELRSTMIKVLLTIFLGTSISLFFYPQVFGILTFPHREASNKAKLHDHFVVEDLSRTRVKNISGKEALYTIPQGASQITQSSGAVKQESENTYLIPVGESIDFEKPHFGSQLILLSPAEGLTTILKTSFWVGLIATSPIWLYFILQFAAPGLRTRERKMLLPFLTCSLLFMAMGFAFAFYATIPIANHYLMEINQTLGQNFWSLSQYLNYTILLLFANGLAFESSVILLFLVHGGWITADGMRRKRKAVIVGIFIASAILTPPDVLTQILLAAPLIALYEAAILYAQLKWSRRANKASITGEMS